MKSKVFSNHVFKEKKMTPYKSVTDAVVIDFQNEQESNIMIQIKSAMQQKGKTKTSSSDFIDIIYDICHKFSYRSITYCQECSAGYGFFIGVIIAISMKKKMLHSKKKLVVIVLNQIVDTQ